MPEPFGTTLSDGTIVRLVAGQLMPGSHARELWEVQTPDGDYHFVRWRDDDTYEDTRYGRESAAVHIVRSVRQQMTSTPLKPAA